MQYPGARSARFLRRGQSRGLPAARKEPKSRISLCNSVQSHDAVGCQRRDRAVGLKISVQGIDVVDAELLPASFLQDGKTVASDREIIVHRHAIALRGIDALAV